MNVEMNIKKRVTEDEYKLGDRTFILEKYNPLTGNYLLFKVFTSLLPLGLDKLISKNIPGSGAMDNLTRQPMSKVEFVELQQDILSSVYERLPAGRTPVIRQDGTFGCNPLTSPETIQLMIATLAFNFADFFADGGLMEFFNAESISAPPNTAT